MNTIHNIKICTKCSKEKQLDEFYKDSRNIDKHQSACKECYNTQQNLKYSKEPEHFKLKSKQYRLCNPDKIKRNSKSYYINNRQNILKYQSQYQINNRLKYNEIQYSYIHNNINAKLGKSIRNRIRLALKNNQKSGHTMELLGCTVEEFKQHLENNFINGMTWLNYGNKKEHWNIDHIIPCSFFNLEDPVEQKQCFHYTNCQPMWHIENIKKGNKINI